MKESQIRPPELKEAQERAKELDRAWLRGKRQHFVSVNCPACEDEVFSPRWGKYSFPYWECESCHTVYMTPRPTEAVLAEYHRRSENYKYWAEHIFPAAEDARLKEIALPRAAHVFRLCGECGLLPTNLLDIGAGYGTFCRAAQQFTAWETAIFAIEPVPALASVCRASGFTTFDRPVAQQEFVEGTFEVITAWEVVEHVFSPRAFLEKCLSWLIPGGLLFLSCPNVKGFDVIVLEEQSGTVEHEHLNYFHPASITGLLLETGFDVLEVTTPGRLDAELVRHAVLEGTFGQLWAQPFLRRVLIEDWERLGSSFQTWLASAGLSSHMQIVCRRES